MKDFWRLYLKRQLPALGLFAACAVIFFLSFALYELPMAAVGYPALICLVLCIVFILIRGAKSVRKHLILSALTESFTSDMLPEAETVDDADYRRIIGLLQEAGRRQEGSSAKKYADMVEYYTLWAHQIKTPIAAMRLTLQNEDTQLSRRLMSELGRVERYVEMVLAYLRLDGESTDYLLREYDLDSVIRSSVRKFSGEFIDRKLALDFQPTGIKVLTDEKWLSFVLEQLISNALKYTPSGKVTIRLEEPSTLCVEDTGIGIAPEDLPRIFDQGFTGHNGRTDKRASGLGLYLCRRVCRNLGHSIAVESEPGKGTAIKLDLSRKKLTAE